MSTKENVLALLENSRGKSVSGEFMAGTLSISRNAVWKAINELKKDGYKIESSTNKGYCLCDENDIISAQGISHYLNSAIAMENIKVYQSIESTNKSAMELALAGAEHGTVVIADCQTMGKGRFNRQFFSPANSGIYMSVILRTDKLNFEIPTMITVFAAIAVCEAIKNTTSKKPMIKWVNDIYLDGKKVCGILTEAVTDFESGNSHFVVVGIGINFSTAESVFPSVLREKAGSIFSSDSQSTTRNNLIAQIINNIMQSPKYSSKEIISKYKSLLFILGKNIQVIEAKKTYNAVATDIDNIGRLIVKTADGEERVLLAGEISILC